MLPIEVQSHVEAIGCLCGMGQDAEAGLVGVGQYTESRRSIGNYHVEVRHRGANVGNLKEKGIAFLGVGDGLL